MGWWSRQDNIVSMERLTSPFKFIGNPAANSNSGGGRQPIRSAYDSHSLPFFIRSKIFKSSTGIRVLVSTWICVLIYIFYLRYDAYSSIHAVLSQQLNSKLGTNIQPGQTVMDISDANKAYEAYLSSILQPEHKNFDPKYVVHSDNYESLASTFGLSKLLNEFTFQERCDLYFKNLYRTNAHWGVDPGFDYSFERAGFKSLEKYTEEEIKKYREEKQKELKIEDASGIKVPDDFEIKVKQKWEEAKLLTSNHEQLIHNSLAHVKIFNKCYLQTNIAEVELERQEFIEQQRTDLSALGLNKITSAVQLSAADEKNLGETTSFKTCGDVEGRLYPWLSGKFPKYVRWDGTTYTKELPRMCKYLPGEKCVGSNKLTTQPVSPVVGNGHCFTTTMKNQLNHKGIGITIGDKHVKIIIRLIRLLRSLDNKLPIEIIYNKDLSQESKDQIVKASRTQLIDDSGKKLIEQEVWFVDVNPALAKAHDGRFGGFGNKILATLFNSFSEFILLDADTVLLQQPEYFFNLPKYKEYGTLFYKDRTAPEHRPKDDLVFFRKLMPSEYDTAFFNFPQITGYTLDRTFFKGWNHYMESGLVVFDRKRHFAQALIMSQLNFIRPAHSRVYGDKELFWLAMTVYGEESYYFNKHAAASVGAETPEIERVKNSKVGKTSFKSRELCSNHPAHINDQDDHTLLWFNSGFQFCGQCDNVDFEKEQKEGARFLQHSSTVEQFKTFFENKLRITEAIIPPGDADLGLIAVNDEHEPDRGWVNMRQYCNGYTWCAYSSIGGDIENKETKEKTTSIQLGHFIRFNSDETEQFAYLGDVWMKDFDFRSEKQKKIDIKKEAEEKKKKEEEEKKKNEEEEKKKKEEEEKKRKEEEEKKKQEEANK